jgi:hypothetical protein
MNQGCILPSAGGVCVLELELRLFTERRAISQIEPVTATLLPIPHTNYGRVTERRALPQIEPVTDGLLR